MLPDISQLPPDHRSGFIAVIGRPNVGKSTLFNRLLDQKIAITSPKPQTTRDQLLGILTTEDSQLIFLDTPGIHKPQNKLGEYMMNIVTETLQDADIILWLVDVNTSPRAGDKHIATLLQKLHRRHAIQHLVIGLNKVDRLMGEGEEDQLLEQRQQEYYSLVDWLTATDKNSENHNEDVLEPLTLQSFSALEGEGVPELFTHLRSLLPVGPRYFPEDQVTDLQVRFIVEELIREKALSLLAQEVPHSIAVAIDEFVRRNEKMTYISAVLYVERDSQKKIVLGRNGSMIKKIGQVARPEIEELVETKVYLELWVKVWPKWRKQSGMLQRLGYAT